MAAAMNRFVHQTTCDKVNTGSKPDGRSLPGSSHANTQGVPPPNSKESASTTHADDRGYSLERNSNHSNHTKIPEKAPPSTIQSPLSMMAALVSSQNAGRSSEGSMSAAGLSKALLNGSNKDLTIDLLSQLLQELRQSRPANPVNPTLAREKTSTERESQPVSHQSQECSIGAQNPKIQANAVEKLPEPPIVHSKRRKVSQDDAEWQPPTSSRVDKASSNRLSPVPHVESNSSSIAAAPSRGRGRPRGSSSKKRTPSEPSPTKSMLSPAECMPTSEPNMLNIFHHEDPTRYMADKQVNKSRAKDEHIDKFSPIYCNIGKWIVDSLMREKRRQHMREYQRKRRRDPLVRAKHNQMERERLRRKRAQTQGIDISQLPPEEDGRHSISDISTSSHSADMYSRTEEAGTLPESPEMNDCDYFRTDHPHHFSHDLSAQLMQHQYKPNDFYFQQPVNQEAENLLRNQAESHNFQGVNELFHFINESSTIPPPPSPTKSPKTSQGEAPLNVFLFDRYLPRLDEPHISPVDSRPSLIPNVTSSPTHSYVPVSSYTEQHPISYSQEKSPERTSPKEPTRSNSCSSCSRCQTSSGVVNIPVQAPNIPSAIDPTMAQAFLQQLISQMLMGGDQTQLAMVAAATATAMAAVSQQRPNETTEHAVSMEKERKLREDVHYPSESDPHLNLFPEFFRQHQQANEANHGTFGTPSAA